MTGPHLALAGIAGLVGVVMGAEGVLKLAGVDSQVQGFREFGYPQWFRLLVGGLELLGGLGVLAGLLAGEGLVLLAGATVVVIVLLGAVGTHLRVHDPLSELVPAALLAILTILVMVAELAWT